MRTTSLEKLEHEIEASVRAHLELVRRSISSAVERGFSSSGPRRAQVSTKPKRRARERRGGAEIDALAERLYAAICANPGAGMVALKRTLGATTKELERPMLRLREQKRVRKVGKHSLMRYFPRVQSREE